MEVKSGHLLIHEVPYVNAAREVKRGTLVSTLTLQADETTKPDTHVAYLIGEYTTNIQVADLNALNAALAVIRWKKHFGFYSDLEEEHNSVYVIDGNTIVNEDQP